MIEVKRYDLPDFLIFNSEKKFDYCIWQPDNIYLVLGLSNKVETSIITANVIQDRITVYQRSSGGETVILTPNMFVISVLFKTIKLKNPKEYFSIINTSIIQALEKSGVSGPIQRGISDIALGEKKILGSAIYRKPDKVFYHAVLNVAERTELIEKYIAHPLKEPDYRKGREHKEFVTSIEEEGYSINYETLKSNLFNEINQLEENLKRI